MMRKANQLLILGSAATLASGAALAGPPVPFDQWSVTNGTVTVDYGGGATCPTGFTCGAALTGDGFFQRQLTDNATGAKYFQTIVTDLGATGSPASLSFADESYVMQGGTTGIANQQRMDSTTPGQGTLTATSVLNMGWAHAAGSPDVDIMQTVSDAATGLTSSMTFKQNRDTNGNATGTALDLDQSIVLDAVNNDKQGFVLRKRDGDLNGTSRDAAVDPPLLPAGATPSDNMSWAATDNIQVVWIGQAVTTTAGSQDKFGYQGYTNFSVTPNATISYFDTASFGDTPGKGGWNWQTTPFGPQPVFP